MDNAFENDAPVSSGTAPLRRGWTTGTCATAAAMAAGEVLFGGEVLSHVMVRLPRGGTATLTIAWSSSDDHRATAAVIKDAGDDPDVTHGSEVVVTVEPLPVGSGIRFRAGEGVGTVTLPGLPVAVGEPAINPVPRAMITEAVSAVAARHGARADAIVTIAIPGGEALAERTLNGRLGVVGGLSILGTTGVVVPYSCASWIHSIHRGIDVARAAGLSHLAAATGSTSEAAVKAHHGLADTALIDMGDFVGGTLKYLRLHPVPRLTLAGGFAKLVKLAQGHLLLHSSKSRVDFYRLADRFAEVGGSAAAIDAARTAAAAAHVLALAAAEDVALADAIGRDAQRIAKDCVDASMALDVVVVDRNGRIVAEIGA